MIILQACVHSHTGNHRIQIVCWVIQTQQEVKPLDTTALCSIANTAIHAAGNTLHVQVVCQLT
jgi:hypothetical protein